MNHGPDLSTKRKRQTVKSINLTGQKDGIITDTIEITKKNKRVQQTITSIKWRT